MYGFYCLRRVIANDYSPRRTKLLEVHFCSDAQCTFAAMIGFGGPTGAPFHALLRTRFGGIHPAYRNGVARDRNEKCKCNRVIKGQNGEINQLIDRQQGVTKRCSLSWLTNSALVNEPKCGGGGKKVAGSQPMSTAVHMEPKKQGKRGYIGWRNRFLGSLEV